MIKVIPVAFYALAIQSLLAQSDPSSPKLAASWTLDDQAHIAAPWQASWIGVKEPPAPNQWICYRKTIHLAEAPTQAVARIAVDSKYWLWINGNPVVIEGQLKRGPTPNDNCLEREKDFRFGHRQTLDGSDLIVWLKLESDKPANISIQPAASPSLESKPARLTQPLLHLSSHGYQGQSI